MIPMSSPSILFLQQSTAWIDVCFFSKTPAWFGLTKDSTHLFMIVATLIGSRSHQATKSIMMQLFQKPSLLTGCGRATVFKKSNFNKGTKQKSVSEKPAYSTTTVQGPLGLV
jgi:hypothetical protein